MQFRNVMYTELAVHTRKKPWLKTELCKQCTADKRTLQWGSVF